jgi:hypothetical protein
MSYSEVDVAVGVQALKLSLKMAPGQEERDKYLSGDEVEDVGQLLFKGELELGNLQGLRAVLVLMLHGITLEVIFGRVVIEEQVLAHIHLEKRLSYRSINGGHCEQEYAIETSHISKELQHGVHSYLLNAFVFVYQDVNSEEGRWVVCL